MEHPHQVPTPIAGSDNGNTLKGVAASGGIVRGKARVVNTGDDLDAIEPGEILVCRITAPSWAPVFTKIAAAVSDIGGIMAHTAIVSREYGLPAVVGTGFATQRIATGQLIEVNGDDGVVAGGKSTVRNVTATGNDGIGIVVGAGSTVDQSKANGNQTGIRADSKSLVKNSTATGNAT